MGGILDSIRPPMPVDPGELTPSDEVRERLARLYARPVTLDVQALSKRFAGEDGDVLALDRISFQTHRRELICVIGPSGCGKSTLIRILAGLDEPSSGQMLLDGKSVKGPGPDRGMVFQGYTLFPWRTVMENVMFGPQMRGLGKDAAAEEAREWVEIVGLRRFASAYPYQLSGGMKQRVAIARALANRPRILFMDEPFAALDAQTRAQMQSHLLKLWKNVDITIVFVTHDLDEAVLLADRIVVLSAHPGRVKEIVESPLPRPRTREMIVSPLFQACKRHLEHLIHDGATDTEPPPASIRMTQVGDDVE